MKTEQEIKEKLDDLMKDERITEYPSADIFTNAPLALEQVAMASRINALEWALNKPLTKFPCRGKHNRR